MHALQPGYTQNPAKVRIGIKVTTDAYVVSLVRRSNMDEVWVPTVFTKKRNQLLSVMSPPHQLQRWSDACF